MRNLRRAFVLVLLVLFAPRIGAARQYRIQHFDARIEVNADGTIEVTELIEARFIGSYNGIYRTIPVEYTTPQQLNYTLFIKTLSVTDDDAHPLKYEESRKGRYLKYKIWVPGAQDATRSVILHYRVLDGLRFFEDHDELYWNVTGDEWDVPLESVSAHIELPAGVTGLHAIAYSGVYGSRAQDARVIAASNSVDVQSARPLEFHEGITAVVGWDKGFVHEPGIDAKAGRFFQSNWPLLIPLAAALIMFWLWWTRGRDPEHGSVTVQYDPPDKLTPAECGTLLDSQAAMRDITATIVDLAVKGYLTIQPIEESHLISFMHNSDYIFHLKKPAAEWASARPHEKEMLSAMFDEGANTDVKLSDLQNHFYTHLPGIRDAIFDALMADGYYLHRPDTVRGAYMGTGFILGVLFFAFNHLLVDFTGVASLTWFIAGVGTGAIILIFGWFMTARTLTGARTLEKVLGFEDFLGRVESDRIERLEKTPELFEKYLPYAMALHVEKKWVQAFSGIAMQPPQWYQGAYVGTFQPYLLVNDLNMMSTRAGSVMASSPRSSGGSGFGGGGFSGGGFGGGGGGAF